MARFVPAFQYCKYHAKTADLRDLPVIRTYCLEEFFGHDDG